MDGQETDVARFKGDRGRAAGPAVPLGPVRVGGAVRPQAPGPLRQAQERRLRGSARTRVGRAGRGLQVVEEQRSEPSGTCGNLDVGVQEGRHRGRRGPGGAAESFLSPPSSARLSLTVTRTAPSLPEERVRVGRGPPLRRDGSVSWQVSRVAPSC